VNGASAVGTRGLSVGRRHARGLPDAGHEVGLRVRLRELRLGFWFVHPLGDGGAHDAQRDTGDVELGQEIEENVVIVAGIERNLTGAARFGDAPQHDEPHILDWLTPNGVAGRLYGGRVPPMCVGLQDYFRDVIDHLGRIDASVDAMRDTIGVAIQVNLSLVTIDDGEVTKRLAAWAAIFGVCTVFVGVWGMNFEFMPELKWHYGYPAALGLIGTVCGILYWRFRKAGWV